jgi:hypothetical protein
MCCCFRGCWFFAISVAAAHIYREDLPRVTASCNRLGLSLSKRIRRGLIAKINDKKSLRACEALGWISVDYSRARRASMPITSPRLATPRPGPVRRASACVCFPLSPFLHTLTSAYRATNLISRLPSISTSKVGLKSYHPPCMNVPLRFIRNY